MKDYVLCYACGGYGVYNVPGSLSRKMEEYKKFRDKHNCNLCGAPLEIIKNLELGKERIAREAKEYQKKAAEAVGHVQ